MKLLFAIKSMSLAGEGAERVLAELTTVLKVTGTLSALGFDVVAAEEYLLSRRIYRPENYERYRDRCNNTRMMIFRKCAE